MAKTVLSITNRDSFVLGLRARARDVKAAKSAEVTAVGKRAVEIIKQDGPRSEGAAKYGVHLSDSYEVVEERINIASFSVVVATWIPYAEFVEFGTSKMEPIPHLRPALAQAITEWRIGRIR